MPRRLAARSRPWLPREDPLAAVARGEGAGGGEPRDGAPPGAVPRSPPAGRCRGRPSRRRRPCSRDEPPWRGSGNPSPKSALATQEIRGFAGPIRWVQKLAFIFYKDILVL